MRPTPASLWFVLLAALVGSASAAVTTFDAATGLVTMPSVSVGDQTFSGVTLRHQGNYVFTLEGAAAEPLAFPGVARYDLQSSVLTIPAVKVGGTTYLDVALRNTGNDVFTLQSAIELPPATAAAVQSFIAAYDTLWATAVPANGAARTAPLDGCYLNEGRSKAWIATDFDADLAGSRRREDYVVGRQTVNVQVTAVRSLRNPDGSLREEIDTEYDVVYRDGSVAAAVTNTLIRGSSSGTPGCATPQDGSELRFFGNQQLVAVEVRARNVREDRHAIADGSALSPRVRYRRQVQWQVTDPLGNATHVVVSGPGPAAAAGATTVPFSLKFISPRLLRGAPELLGKPGNFVNWRDDDAFRYCRAPGGETPVAPLADCTGLGATAYELGIVTGTPTTAADEAFMAQGWTAGATYRFDVYRDDGWKTVGGHIGRTPLATYYAVLPRLPYTFVEMAGSGINADRFPRMSFPLDAAQLAANATSATPSAMRVTWNTPPVFSDQRRFVLYQGWEFHQGPRIGNPGGAANPAYRTLVENFPGSVATVNPAWTVTAKPADQASKSYVEFTLLYTDRQNGNLLSIYSLQ